MSSTEGYAGPVKILEDPIATLLGLRFDLGIYQFEVDPIWS